MKGDKIDKLKKTIATKNEEIRKKTKLLKNIKN